MNLRPNWSVAEMPPYLISLTSAFCQRTVLGQVNILVMLATLSCGCNIRLGLDSTSPKEGMPVGGASAEGCQNIAVSNNT